MDEAGIRAAVTASLALKQRFFAESAGLLLTVGLSGNGGGDLVGLVHHLVDVPHTDTARIQEVHVMVVHVLCQIVEESIDR